MKRTRGLLAVAAAGIVLVGCSSGGHSPPRAAPTASGATYSSASAVVDALLLDGVPTGNLDDIGGGMGAASEVYATVDGVDGVQVATFADRAAENDWMAAGAQLAKGTGPLAVAVGDNWVAVVPGAQSRRVAGRITAALGGKVDSFNS